MIWICRECSECSCAVAFNQRFPEDMDYIMPDKCPWEGCTVVWKPLEIVQAIDQDSWQKTDKNGVRGDPMKEHKGGRV